jgi:hypothetical protein
MEDTGALNLGLRVKMNILYKYIIIIIIIIIIISRI